MAIVLTVVTHQSAMYIRTGLKLGSAATALTVSYLSSTKWTVAFCSLTICLFKICLQRKQYRWLNSTAVAPPCLGESSAGSVSKSTATGLPHSKAQHSTPWHGMAQHKAAQRSTAQHSAAQRGTARQSAVQRSLAQQNAAQRSRLEYFGEAPTAMSLFSSHWEATSCCTA